MLRVFDRPPTGSAGGQVWKGGTTGLTTRTMMAEPPRWLQILDHTTDPPPPDRPPARSWTAVQIYPGTLPSPDNAGGVILVSMNDDPTREDQFNDWYDLEHIPHFNRLPGWMAANEAPWILRMRRFQRDRTHFMFRHRDDRPEGHSLVSQIHSLTPDIIGRALDNAKLTPQLKFIIAVAAAGFLFDSFDITIVAYALLKIRQEFELSPQQVGLAGSAALAIITSN